jgi:hypothetical protein
VFVRDTCVDQFTLTARVSRSFSTVTSMLDLRLDRDAGRSLGTRRRLCYRVAAKPRSLTKYTLYRPITSSSAVRGMMTLAENP